MPPIVLTESEGGVEEKKEDERIPPAAVDAPHRLSSDASGEHAESFDEQKDGFQAKVESFAKSLCSCGQALSCLEPSGEVVDPCRWPGNTNPQAPPRVAQPAPLSIADELHKLATKEGRVFGGGMRRADIPRFLGEEAVYSWDDDNISAISQHTLEEMARHGIKYSVRRRPSNESNASSKDSDSPPPRVTSCSTSTRSSRDRRKQRLAAEHHRKDRSKTEKEEKMYYEV